MKQKIRQAFVLLAGAILLSATGCATLGMASPFSKGADYYKDAKAALEQGRYAEAFDYASYAIVKDEKHYPSYRLIVKNYEDGMTAISTELEELANSEPAIQSQIRKVDIYDHLVNFMSYIDAHGNPAVVTFKKDSVTIPITDYAVQLEEARQLGFDLAMEKGRSQLESEDFDGADETFETVLDEFTVNDDEDAVRAQIADQFAARGEAYVAELTYEMVEDVNALIAKAETYAETDRVQALRTDLDAKALDLTLGEARRIAEGGTVEAYREAIIVAHDAYEFVEDNTEIDELRRSWARKAMELSLAQIDRVEPRYDGTISGLEPVRAAYKDMLRWIDGWESITDYKGIPARYADFIERSKIRVYAVKGGDLPGGVVEDVLEATRDAVRSRSDVRYWFHTSEEISTATEESSSRLGEELQRDNDSDYLAALDALTFDSSTQDASALNVKYLIRISADAGEATTKRNNRSETKKQSGHKTTEGEIQVAPAIFYSPFRKAAEKDEQTLRKAMADSDVTNMWFDVPVEYTYTSISVRQPVSYTVIVERCSDGRQIYSDQFSFTYSAAGDEELTNVTSPVGDITSHLSDDIDEPRTPRGASKDDVAEGFAEEFDPSALASAILRD